jgi:hypothetical protein
MDKTHPLSTPMVVWSLDVKNDPFRPREDNEELLGPEVPKHQCNWCTNVSC